MKESEYYEKQCRALRLRKKLARFKTACRSITRRTPAAVPPRNSSPITKLPTEILLLILHDLPLVPKACLALTCRSMYHLLWEDIHNRNLRYPSNTLTYSFAPREGPRWEFICQIQDEFRLVCSSCHILHPFNHFRPNQIFFKKNNTRICHLGNCSGIVDICPCKKITFRQKVRLLELLERQQRQQQNPPPPAADVAPFGGGVRSSDQESPWHRCHGIWRHCTIHTSVYPRLRANGDLALRTEYTCVSGRSELNIWSLPRGLCPHRFMSLDTDVVMPSSRRPREPPYRIKSYDCVQCKTHVSVSAYDLGRKKIFRFVVDRNLGSARHTPDQTWYSQISGTRLCERKRIHFCSIRKLSRKVGEGVKSLVKHRARWMSPVSSQDPPQAVDPRKRSKPKRKRKEEIGTR